MPRAHEQLRVMLFEDKAATLVMADLSGRYTTLVFTTAQHGGFKDLRLVAPMSVDESWLWMHRESLPGHHYRHLRVSEDQRTVWEGRVADVEFRADSGFVGVEALCFGYWSAYRDRYYDQDDAGNTNWGTAGPHNAGKVIREMTTNSAPDINGTADIDLNSRDIVGIDLTARAYPQDIIVDKLAPLADSDGSLYYMAVWEDRKPYWKPRPSGASVDWYVWLDSISHLRVRQQGKHLRNYVLPIVGTAEGTSTTDAESTGLYPRRELRLTLPAGIPSAAANDARDQAVEDRRFPAQDLDFTVSGRVYSSKVHLSGGTSTVVEGAMAERPKWWVRAGDVIRVQDLVPRSAGTGSLDALRTFVILETSYDAVRDVLTVQPDRPASRLDVILPRIGTMEGGR